MKKLIIAGLAVGMVLVGCSSSQTKEKEDLVMLSAEDMVFEYGNDIYPSDIMWKFENYNKQDYELKLDGEEYTSAEKPSVGKHKLVIKSDSFKTLKTIIEIKDTTAPTITQNTKDAALNSTDDFTTYFSAEDLSGATISAVDTSQMDLATAGKYTVSVTATDQYDNSATNDFEIQVHDYAAEEAEAQAKAKEAEAELTKEEENRAEAKAVEYLGSAYNVSFGWTTSDYIIKYDVSDTEYEIEVSIKGKINKVSHRFLVRLSTTNHEVGSVKSVVIDGVRVEG